jgi:hypothetical protein
MIVADFIKQLNESLITLPEDMFQLNCNVIGVAQHHASEEEK